VSGELAAKYQTMMVDEINSMTYIADPATSIKNPAQCKEKERELKKKYFCHSSHSSQQSFK